MEWLQFVGFGIALPMFVIILALWNGAKDQNDRDRMDRLIGALEERNKK